MKCLQKPSYAVVLTASKKGDPVSMEAVGPVLETVPIARSRISAAGGVVLHCDSPDAAARAVECVRAKLPDVEAHVPNRTPLSPKVTVANIPDMTAETFLAGLRQKNPPLADVPDSDLRVLFLTRPRGSVRHAVLSISPSVRSIMKQHGDRVYIGLQSCQIYDRFWVARCRRLAGLGHKADRCSATKECCGHCAGDHPSDKCPDRTISCCTNCNRSYIVLYKINICLETSIGNKVI